MDPNTLISSAAAPRSYTNQSTEHKNTQVPNPSMDTIMLNTEITKQNLRVCLPDLLVVLTSERVQLVCSTMHIPTMLQKTPLNPKPALLCLTY